MSSSVSILPNPSAGLLDNFGTGQVINYAAAFFIPPAALASQVQSQWYVAQWGQPIAINSDNYTRNDPATFDPVYGNALYSWTEPKAISSIKTYQNTTALGGGYVYDLTSGNTTLPPSSGATEEADMFLSSPSTTANANLSHPITLSLNAKIAQSLIQFASPQDELAYATSGSVFGTLDIGITINFNGADGLPAYSGFIQIVPWTSDSSALADYTSGALSTTDASAQFVSSILRTGDPALSLLSADAEANPDTLTYNVNNYVSAELQIAYANFSTAQKGALLNMANWTLGGVYVGPATNDAQVTSSTGVVSLVAQEAVGIQVSAISVTSNLSATYNPAVPVAAVAKIDTNPQITFYDNGLKSGGTVDGSVYSGPLAGIGDKYIYTGADNVDLTAPAGANWEFGGGSGPTQLTAISGDNIFVASTGSSHMVGGTGLDTFDVADANKTGVGTWDVINNFHVGDTILLAGLSGPGWTYSWYGALGPSGSSGLTLLASSTTTPGLNELVTLAGLSMHDLPSLNIATAASSGELTIVRINPQISSYDLSTGVSGFESGNDANITGISAQYLYTGSHSMAFIAPAGENWEFGGGSAFTQLSASSGNNIFVASTGSSFMQGGSGNDVFDIPDANLTGGGVWDSISNFHAGDSMTLAGLGGAGWTYSWTGAYGTAANPGLTLEATSTTTAGVSALVTLNGLNMSDLASLTITHGSGLNTGALIISR